MTARPLILLALLTAACTVREDRGAISQEAYDAPAISPEAYEGSGIATALGTPFYALAKSAVCMAGAVLGGLSSAAVQLTDRPEKAEQRASIHESIGVNCRGPYYLPPSY